MEVGGFFEIPARVVSNRENMHEDGTPTSSIAVNHSGDDPIQIVVEGGLDLATVEHLMSVLDLLGARTGVAEIFLDLGGVTSVDSFGLEPILSFGRRLAAGCQLTILPSDCVERLLFMFDENDSPIARVDPDGIVTVSPGQGKKRRE